LVTSRQSRQLSGTAVEDGDYYKLLGVPYSATFKEITRAYREAMKRTHPDRQSPEQRAAAEERAKQLNRAFTTLSKAETRRAYDAEIKASAIQDQIMSRYAGGLGMPGAGGDLNGESLRRTRTREERADQLRADRSAIASMLIVFAGITLFVIALLVLWTLVGALFGSLF
jgi:DnaJ-class molecular chaperone